MSVWVTQDVMRCALRFCSRRSQWSRRSFLMTSSIQDTSSSNQLSHVWRARQSQTRLTTSPVSSVRFYSHVVDVGDSSQPAEINFKQKLVMSPFKENLQRCGSPSDVLDFCSQYELTAQQVKDCLKQMWSTTKKMSVEQRRYELQLMFEHPWFEKLLQKTIKHAGHMHSEVLSYSLLSLINLGVSHRSRVVQTLLRACQEKLNDFSETGLSILASCLQQVEDSPNVSALKKGMRLIIEARLPQLEQVLVLQTLMRLLWKDIPLPLKQKLEKKALSMSDQFTLSNAQYMISTMAATGLVSKPLMGICVKKIKENLPGISFGRLFSVLQACQKLHYRDVDLLNKVSDYISSMIPIWPNKNIVLSLLMFKSFAFSPTALMEAYADKVIDSPDTLTLQDLLLVLNVYSSLNYNLQDRRQQFLDSVNQVLESYLPTMAASKLLKCVYFLCLLGHFPSAPLERLLQSSSIEELNNTPAKFLQNKEKMFQTVDLCLRLDRPHLPRPLAVPQSVLADPTPSRPSDCWLLSQSLRSMLEDQEDMTLQEMVMVEDFYLIEAVINKPLPNRASATEARSGETEESPAGSSQRVAVICPHYSAFCFGTSHPRASLAIKLRHLKILGYDPVVVTEQQLRLLSEKKTEFLREQIFPEDHRPDAQPEREQL